MTNVSLLANNVCMPNLTVLSTQFYRFNFNQYYLFIQYIKRQNVVTLRVLMPDGTSNVDVTNQPVNSTQTYSVLGPVSSRSLYPQPYQTQPISSEVLTDQYSFLIGEQNYIKVGRVINNSIYYARTVELNIKDISFYIMLEHLNPNVLNQTNEAIFIVVDTLDMVKVRDPDNSYDVEFRQYRLPLSAAYVENLTVTVQEVDSNNNVVDTGFMVTKLYWLNIYSPVPSVAVIGGTGSIIR